MPILHMNMVVQAFMNVVPGHQLNILERLFDALHAHFAKTAAATDDDRHPCQCMSTSLAHSAQKCLCLHGTNVILVFVAP